MLSKRKIIKTAAAILSAALVGLFGTAEYYSSRLPAVITAESSKELTIAGYPELSCISAPDGAMPAAGARSDTERVTLTLFGAIPVKNVEVREAEAPVLAVGGNPFGIKLLMEGVMVTGLGEVENESGELSCPAEEAGIRIGDVIRLANGEKLTSNEQLQEAITASQGDPVELLAERDGEEFTACLQPVFSQRSHSWKGGMWVRDSIAGIGTMTFFSKATGEFAGLGHPICDADTGAIVPIHSGEAVPVEITETRRGARGVPGELRGRFSFGESFGSLSRNNGSGIYGRLTEEALAALSEDCIEYKMGYRQEITTGPAEIYTTVSGEAPEKYSIEIESVDYNSSGSSKNMVIRITDQRLLDASGGIVQGMSGSPIIQGGKLIGAVTHVFVSDPTCGYGIFAENMAQYLSEQ